MLTPALYLAAGLLNYNQIGKATLLGVLLLAALSAWQAEQAQPKPKRQIGLLLAIALGFYALMGFQAFLRQFFGAQPEDMVVFDALFNTNANESWQFLTQSWRGIALHAGLVSLALLLYGGLNWLHTRWFYAHRVWPITPAVRWRLGALGGLALLLFVLLHFNPTMRRTNPLFYFPERHARWQGQLAEVEALQKQLASTAQQPALQSLRLSDNSPRTVIFMLGETMTRHNLSLHGYSRATTPKLQAQAADLSIFGNVLSAAPATDAALKLMLTPATLSQPELWQSQPDVLTMAKKAGYKTFWLSNQETHRGAISVFASHADERVFTNKGTSRGESSHDAVLLPAIAAALQDPAAHKFIVVHMLGSHFTYRFRYPKNYAQFDWADDAVRQSLQAQGRAPWAILERDQYDNSILYSDEILNLSLKMAQDSVRAAQLAQQPTKPPRSLAWLYAPDHGEDVAHHSNFSGHNFQAPEQWEIPMLAWRSDAVPEQAHLGQRPYQNDVLDHTLLGLLRIEGAYYQAQHDVFSPQFLPKPRLLNGGAYAEQGQAIREL